MIVVQLFLRRPAALQLVIQADFHQGMKDQDPMKSANNSDPIESFKLVGQAVPLLSAVFRIWLVAGVVRLVKRTAN